MRGRWRRATAMLAAILLLAQCTSGEREAPRPHQRDARPNVVFVLTDDLSSDLVQYMPHVIALEREGVSFSNYFVVDSLCCPSRAAIFTGQYPHDDGVFTNGGSDGGYGAFQRHGNADKTFAVALHKAGYRTAFMGKYLNGYLPVNKRGAGWDQWVVGGDAYREFDYRLNENGAIRAYGHAPDDYLTDVLSDKASNFIRAAAKGSKPFALEVATFAPHRPWTPAPRDRGTFAALHAPRDPSYNRANTDAPRWLRDYPSLSISDQRTIDHVHELRVEAVQAVDRMIGQLQRTLTSAGVARKTYVVFSSDNGFHLGQHRLLPGKQTAFDTDIRVPLVVSGPGVPAHRTVGAFASNIDLAPTFTQLGGATPAARIDGASLAQLWHGGAVPATWPRSVLVEHHGPPLSPTDPDTQPVRSGDPPDYEAIRTGSAMYVEYADGDREYYDIARDPYEQHNVVAQLSPRRRAELHDALHALEVCHGAAACRAAARRG